MELRQLRCFLMVAETLHFGRAARRMDMLPASFGRQIKLLEDSLGSRLLIRSTRHVTLTDAGRDLVNGAREIIARVDALEEKFRSGERLQPPSLRIGAIDSAALGLIPQVLPLFRAAEPGIAVELLEQKTIRLLPRLLSGRLDLAIIRPPETLDPRLESRVLLRETPVVAVPQDHPLAPRDEVKISDMIDAPLIVPDRRSRPHSHDLTMKLFVDAGYPARVVQIAEEKQTIVSLVSSGVGLAIVPRWTARLAVDGVRFIPLNLPRHSRSEFLALSVVWIRHTRHEGRDAFLDQLTTALPGIAKTA